MRVIDADALIDALTGAYNIMESNGLNMIASKTLINIAKNAPTVGPLIRVKEVRQALKALYSFCNSKLQNTNPIAYVSRCDVSFVDLMDDEVTGGFGNWMRANGFNAAITSIRVYIKDMLCTLDKLEDEPAQEVSGDAAD